MDNFKMDDLGKPLYEWSQVLTVPELIATYQLVEAAYMIVPWYRYIYRFRLRLALEVINDLIVFVGNGKQNSLPQGNKNV